MLIALHLWAFLYPTHRCVEPAARSGYSRNLLTISRGRLRVNIYKPICLTSCLGSGKKHVKISQTRLLRGRPSIHASLFDMQSKFFRASKTSVACLLAVVPLSLSSATVFAQSDSIAAMIQSAAALPVLQGERFTPMLQSGTPAPMTLLGRHDPRLSKVTEAIAATKTPTVVALSPDGATLAWSLKLRGSGSVIHLTPVAQPSGDHVLEVPSSSPCSNEAPIWSPDGATLAFLSTCTGDAAKPDQQQIFLWSKSNGTIRQLSHLSGGLNQLAWSPNGRALAFLFVENATRKAGALAAMKPWSGVIGEDGVEVQQAAVIDATDGGLNWETSRGLHVYEFGWSPDSKQIVFVAAPAPGENNWWVAKLYTQYVLGRGEEARMGPHPVFDPTTTSGSLHGLQIAVPRFSPDGSRIAFIGGLMSDQGSTGGDIYIVPAAGLAANAEPKDVTPNRPATPVWFKWEDDHTLGINEDARGKNHLFLYNIDTGTDSAEYSQTFDQAVRAGGLKGSVATSDQDIAVILTAFNQPPEIWAGPLNGLKQMTHLNDALKPVWGRSASIEWTNQDLHVQGWLLYPADYDPAKRYPLIVSVHGGPSSSIGSTWGGGGALYSAMGYFVFSPNPRGSFGQGEKFVQANVKDFGYGDLRDILAGMDTLEATLPIDRDREGLTGWSYGGFMTMFSVTQTTRFHAAVAGAGISNWQSYYGENSIDQWMLPFFGATVYDDPAIYAKSSAIDFIHRVKTPTLVIVGDRDGECPAPQSFEFWHALKTLGVKTQLVVYPNEGHGFVNPEHIRDRDERTLDWFATHMPAK